MTDFPSLPESLAAQIIIEILRFEMKLQPDQIWLLDESRDIPNDNRLYMTVGMVNSLPICSDVSMITKTINNVNYQYQLSQGQAEENIQINLLSRTNEARRRGMEALMALQSFYSQQLQERNYFKIFRLPRNFANTSFAEGGSFLKRYTIIVPAMVWYRLEKPFISPLGDYYDDFTQRVDDAKTIGTTTPIVEFEITPTTPPPP